jgi:hypothetical protein
MNKYQVMFVIAICSVLFFCGTFLISYFEYGLDIKMDRVMNTWKIIMLAFGIIFCGLLAFLAIFFGFLNIYDKLGEKK